MKIVSTCFYDHIFPAWTLPEWCADEVVLAFPDIEFVRLTSTDRLQEEIRDADVLMTGQITEEVFHGAPKLKWIHAAMAGLTWILIPCVVESDVLVSNSKGVHAAVMGEHAVALMLAFSRRLHDCMDFQRRGVWGRTEIYNRMPSFDRLAGKTLGVVGFGAIGSEVALRAQSLGMRVIGFKRDTKQPAEFADDLYPPARLDELLPDIDYLVLSVPLTDETKNMIGAAQFKRMKATSVLINLARGEIVDQEAMIAALEGQQIAGAGLDVFVPDPLPDGHPLFNVKNVILTPHVSGTDPAMWRGMTDILVENIRRFREGRKLINQVDKGKGY